MFSVLQQPVDLGGVAGGSKYICQGILFKVALDVRGIYGGDHNAMKAAGSCSLAPYLVSPRFLSFPPPY